jgi:hypothetical protein
MDDFTKQELPYHVYMYRRFILTVRYIVLAHVVAATFVAFAFFIGGGSWVAGIFLAAIVLAIGLYAIHATPVHPHAAMVRQLGVRPRPYKAVRER